VRYLDASHSGMTVNDVTSNHLLVHLRLRFCGVKRLPVSLDMLSNLRILDLSDNNLEEIKLTTFISLGNLKGYLIK
jgi:Leucine-rich repeat (LRR) protein